MHPYLYSMQYYLLAQQNILKLHHIFAGIFDDCTIFSFKKISVSPKTTVFILLTIGIIFISLLYYTFETLLVFGIVYLITIPFSYSMYKSKNNKLTEETADDEHEDVL